MMSFDNKLALCNEADYEVYGLDTPREEKPKIEDATAYAQAGEEIKENKTLPIIMHERELMENIENFVVTLVCGETGSGKSTQLP